MAVIWGLLGLIGLFAVVAAYEEFRFQRERREMNRWRAEMESRQRIMERLDRL